MSDTAKRVYNFSYPDGSFECVASDGEPAPSVLAMIDSRVMRVEEKYPGKTIFINVFVIPLPEPPEEE